MSEQLSEAEGKIAEHVNGLKDREITVKVYENMAPHARDLDCHMKWRMP